MRKPLSESARRKAVRQVMDEMLLPLARLSSLGCPICGSRAFVATLKAHSGIYVRCDGIVLRPEEADNNLEGVCLYQACIPLTIEDEPAPNLIAIEIERNGAAG